MFKPGEKVKFLNEVGGGTVVRMIDPATVCVRTDDDWEIPMALSNLIPIAKESYRLSEEGPKPGLTKIKTRPAIKPQAQHQETTPKASKEEPLTPPKKKSIEEPEPSLFFRLPAETETEDSPREILIAMVPINPQDPTTSDLKLYLINDSSYFLLYNLGLDYDGKFSSRFAGQLEPDTKFHIETFQREQVSGIKGLLFQGIFFRTSIYQSVAPVEKRIKINPTGLFKSQNYRPNDFFEDIAAIFSIGRKDLAIPPPEPETFQLNLLPAPEKPKTQPSFTPKLLQETPDLFEIDLHIEALEKEPENIHPGQILGIQMEKVRKVLDTARLHQIKKVVFIHGVGQGKLKFEIRKELDLHYRGFEYQDASFAEYGYGATMVILPKQT